jgi:Protein of unknown function (DUF4031)
VLYVDDARERRPVMGRDGTWSHLFADSTEELQAAMARLGLRPAWIKARGTAAEYVEIKESTRERAVQLGAEQVTWPTGAARIIARKARSTVRVDDPPLNAIDSE